LREERLEGVEAGGGELYRRSRGRRAAGEEEERRGEERRGMNGTKAVRHITFTRVHPCARLQTTLGWPLPDSIIYHVAFCCLSTSFLTASASHHTPHLLAGAVDVYCCA
jgi:hypothetical protein